MLFFDFYFTQDAQMINLFIHKILLTTLLAPVLVLVLCIIMNCYIQQKITYKNLKQFLTNMHVLHIW